MAAESLKEYLVKLGWNIDELGLAKANMKIDGFKDKVMGLGTGIAGSFLKAGAATFSFIGTATVAMGKLLDSVAQADLATERFARKMWTTESTARSFLTALDAMNASYEDIFYMTPEEYKKFMDLKSLGESLRAPEGLQDGLRLVRDIRHEFNRLKVIANYTTQWVSYYLTKYLGADLEKIRSGFRGFNDWVMSKIPTATEKIAKFFTIIFKLGKSVVTTVGNLIELFNKFWDSLSSGAKKTAGVLAGFAGLLAMGPIGLFIAGLLTLLALLDDFYTWKNGGKSAFGDTWESLSTMFGNINTDGLDDLTGKVNTLLETLGKIGGVLWDLGTDMVDFLDDVKFFEKMWDSSLTTLNFVADVLQTIADLILVITGNFDKLGENSVFRKIAKFDKDGNLDIGKSIAAGGSELTKGITGTSWYDILRLAGGPAGWLSMLVESMLTGNSSQAAVGASGQVSANEFFKYNNKNTSTGSVFNQDNKITVVAAPGESPDTTARKTSREIINQRKQHDLFK